MCRHGAAEGGGKAGNRNSLGLTSVYLAHGVQQPHNFNARLHISGALARLRLSRGAAAKLMSSRHRGTPDSWLLCQPACLDGWMDGWMNCRIDTPSRLRVVVIVLVKCARVLQPCQYNVYMCVPLSLSLCVCV